MSRFGHQREAFLFFLVFNIHLKRSPEATKVNKNDTAGGTKYWHHAPRRRTVQSCSVVCLGAKSDDFAQLCSSGSYQLKTYEKSAPSAGLKRIG